MTQLHPGDTYTCAGCGKRRDVVNAEDAARLARVTQWCRQELGAARKLCAVCAPFTGTWPGLALMTAREILAEAL
jgi:hypothetical protein